MGRDSTSLHRLKYGKETSRYRPFINIGETTY